MQLLQALSGKPQNSKNIEKYCKSICLLARIQTEREA